MIRETIPLIIVVVVVTLLYVKLKHILSNKSAAQNLELFLKNNYGTTLKYKNLERFFNTATMNPNCFTVVIYEARNPNVEMHLTFDASKIVEQKDVASVYPNELSFNETYIEKQQVVATQAVISDKMKPLGVDLKWSYNFIELIFDKSYTENEVLEKEQFFLNLFAKEDTDELGYYHSFTLHLSFKDNEYPLLKHFVEQKNDKWELKDISLNEEDKSFKEVSLLVNTVKNEYLESKQPALKLANYYGTLVNKVDFSRVIWVTYTEHKRTKKELEEAKKGVYVSPINGYVVVYWNLFKKQAQHIAFVSLDEHKSIDEVLEYEKDNLL